MSDINQTLSEAYNLIRENKLSRARDLLTAYMVESPNDADAWWLYAYAVEDAEEARKALQNVTRLDPGYPGARDLMDDLVSATQPIAPIASAEAVRRLDSNAPAQVSQIRRTQSASTVPAGDLGGRVLEDNAAARSGGRGMLYLGVGLLVAIIAVFVLLVLPGLQGTAPTPTATAVANATVAAVAPTAEFIVPTETTVGAEASTDEPVATDAVEPTAEAPTEEAATDTPTEEISATDEPATDEPSATIEASQPTAETPVVFDPSGVYTALATFNVIGGSAVIETTDAGQTLAAGVCRDANQSLRDYSQSVLESLARYAPEAPADVEAIGAKIINCDSGATLRYFAVTREDAEAFATGALSADELRQRLQRLDGQS
jgi:hypothetical protein